jgi:Domain of unknown function (DUF4360)
MPAQIAQHRFGISRLLARGAVHASGLGVACASLASSAFAQTVVIDPDTLQARIVSVDGEGALCPTGSISVSLNETGVAATVVFSQSVDSVGTVGCRLGVVLEVPQGFTMGMPITTLRGVSVGRTRFERRYSFEGAGASDAFIDILPEDFVIGDVADGIESRSCEGSRRVRYTVDVTAQLQSDTTFFQLDSVDIDTAFRFGTDYRFCDRGKTLVIVPGEAGEFCDGPQQRSCAAGLICEGDPNATEGTCAEP